MCEYCTEHGEGKKWYLLMKTFSDELLHQKLTSAQKEIVGVNTRAEWRHQVLSKLLKKASDVSIEKNALKDPSALTESSDAQLGEEELLRRRKATHFGQVLPIEDVEKVLDMVDSIT